MVLSNLVDVAKYLNIYCTNCLIRLTALHRCLDFVKTRQFQLQKCKHARITFSDKITFWILCKSFTLYFAQSLLKLHLDF